MCVMLPALRCWIILINLPPSPAGCMGRRAAARWRSLTPPQTFPCPVNPRARRAGTAPAWSNSLHWTPAPNLVHRPRPVCGQQQTCTIRTVAPRPIKLPIRCRALLSVFSLIRRFRLLRCENRNFCLKVAAVLSNRLQLVGQLFHQQVGVVRHRWFGQCDDVQV